MITAYRAAAKGSCIREQLKVRKAMLMRRLSLMASAAALLSPSVSHAQQVLEEILVTAERREQSVQDLPTSISVLSGKDLLEKGVDNINEIQQFTPGLAVSTLGRTTFINIRGVGIAQSAPSSSTGVAYYIDGVLVPDGSFIGHTFYDISAIEVLRGPQGTLTGQNSTGGAIYVRTPDPDTENVSGYVDQTVGTYGWYKTTGAVNLPVSEKAAFRIAGVYESRDSYTRNIGPSDSTPGDSEMYGLRGNLVLYPSESIKINLRGDYFDYESDHVAVKNWNDLVTSDPFTIEEDARSFLNQNGYRLSGDMRIDLSSDVQFRVLASWQDLESHEQADGDRSATAAPVPPSLPTSRGNTALYPGRVSNTAVGYEAFMTEFNLLSTHTGPFQWVAGAFYLDGEVPTSVLRDNRNTVDFVSSSSDILLEVKNKSKSAFGQINYELSESWELVAGLRYSEDTQDLTRIGIPGPPPSNGFPFTTRQESSQLTGRLSLQYHLDVNSTIYATISKGYKAGGINLPEFQPNYKPERNWVYEVGVKLLTLEDRMRVTGAFFYSDYSDIQFLSVAAYGGFPPLSLTENAASAESYGAELEATYAYENLAFNFGVAYLNSEFSESVFLNNTISGGSELVPKGRSLPFAPEWTFNIGVQYDFRIGEMVLTPRLQYSYAAKQTATPFPLRETIIQSRNILDFRTTLAVNQNISLEGFVTNLTNETYVASQLQSTTGLDGGYVYGAPRQFGLRARYNF